MARAVAAAVIAAVLCAVAAADLMMAGLDGSEVRQLLKAAAATFLRVNLALLLGAAWTVPAGVAIGLSPRLARVAKPVAQIAASVPAAAWASPRYSCCCSARSDTSCLMLSQVRLPSLLTCAKRPPSSG